ncbi:PREDICTED: transmembrane protein 141-like [Priapulus caudatus]|uniref:Transmembrane protein 141-like n=1 Tax=Priapulus caudatus TaxID=37621 RepID=A0ABM1EFR4_PRICU|nr:PREDICTED: transmembrane protein 141-like [Priapulus caudatus]
MNNIGRVPEQYSEKHPGLKSYTKCQSRAFMIGTGAAFLSFTGVYIAQQLLRTSLPYGAKYYILAPVLASCGVGYTVSSRRTQACQRAWMAAEHRRHTYLARLDEEEDERRRGAVAATTPAEDREESSSQT